ncbi:MAG: methyltransferase [Natronospirillum sp.]
MSGLGIALMVLVLSAMLSIVVSTLYTGISPMPSSVKARQAMMRLVSEVAEDQTNYTIVDLGSGWGHLVIPLARRFPQHHIVGYELSWLPWLVSWSLKQALRLDNLVLYRRDCFKAELRGADIITCYLFASAMKRLAKKLEDDGARPRWMVSNFFALPVAEPEQTLQLNDLYQTRIYRYQFRSL